MVTAGDFRNGVTFEMDGNVYSIIEFQHVKPGKGAAFVRTKIRNVISGAVTEKTFNPNDKYPTAFIERKDTVSYTHLDVYKRQLGVYGAIAGKSIYTKALDLTAAITASQRLSGKSFKCSEEEEDHLERYFKKSELIPCIVQEASTNEVLMLAYMNRESMAKTL